MAGLDTRGLADGFLSGFQVMDQYQHRQRQSEQAERQLGMQEQKFGLDMKVGQMKIDEAEQAREKEGIKFALEKAVTLGYDSVTEDEFKTLQNHPEVWAGLDPNADLAIQRAIEVFDPSTSADANNPESLEQANLLFGDLINRGDGGQKRIVGWIPAPNGEDVMLELEVAREDGTTYRAPMTEGRGTEEDALVKSIPMETLVNQIQGLRMLRNGVKAGGPEAQERASQVLQMLRGETPERWEQFEGPGGSLLQRNVNTGKTESVVGREPARGGGGGSNDYAPSTDVRTIEYFKELGYSHEEAVEMTMRLKGRDDDDYGRNKDELDHYQSRISDLQDVKNSREWQGMDEDSRGELNQELQRLKADRDRVANRLYPNGQPSQQGGQNSRSSSSGGTPTVDDILNSVPWE